MKKILLITLAAAIAFAVYKALVGGRQDRSIWAEYTDDIA